MLPPSSSAETTPSKRQRPLAAALASSPQLMAMDVDLDPQNALPASDSDTAADNFLREDPTASQDERSSAAQPTSLSITLGNGPARHTGRHKRLTSKAAEEKGIIQH